MTNEAELSGETLSEILADLDGASATFLEHTVSRDTVSALVRMAQRTVEAEVEVERVTRERDEARELVTEANNSLYGSQGYFHSLNGGPFNKYHLAKGIEDLKQAHNKICRAAEAAESQLAKTRQALEPFAAAAAWLAEHHPGWDHDMFNIDGELGHVIAFRDFRRARAVLAEIDHD